MPFGADVLYLVFRYLDWKDIHSCLLVNKQFHDIANYDMIWKYLFGKYFNDFIHLRSNYKKTFKLCHRLYIAKKFIFNECSFILNNYINIHNIYFHDYFVGRSIDKFPIGICYFPNLEELSIHNMAITHLPSKIKYLTKLKSLSIVRTPVIDLPNELNRLSNLENIVIGYTSITSLPDHLINFPILKALLLNGITDIGYNKIFQLTLLEELTLSNNKMTHLSLSITNLTKLQRLALTHNLLTQLPDQLTSLTQLRLLDLTNNPLAHKGINNIDNLYNLQVLKLSHCGLTDNAISNLSKLCNLQLVDLSYNTLSNDGIRNFDKLSTLRSLYLYNNNLTLFPIHMYNLVSLTLSNNQITSIPDDIGRFTNLQILYMKQNLITLLPNGLFYLSNLQSLDLSCNKISYIPNQITRLNNLHTLSIYDNPTKYYFDIVSLCSKIPNFTPPSLFNSSSIPAVCMFVMFIISSIYLILKTIFRH